MKIDYPHWPHSRTASSRTSPSRLLVETLSLTAELCGAPLSPAAADMLANDLREFDEALILDALARCRMELHGPLKAADILARIEDGRPNAEKAWAMMPRTELASVVWTDEMAQAWGAAQPLLKAGDVAGARAAFGDAYARAVLDARIRRQPAHWTPSLGSDPGGRERVLREAVEQRRLSAAHAEQLLPYRAPSTGAEDILAQIRLKSVS